MAMGAAYDIIFLMTSEIYPTYLRTTSHGVAFAAGRVGAFLGTYLCSGLLAGPWVFAIMVASTMALILLMWLFPFETAGRELDDIAILDNGASKPDDETGVMGG